MSEPKARAAKRGEQSERGLTVRCPPQSDGQLFTASRTEAGPTVHIDRIRQR